MEAERREELKRRREAIKARQDQPDHRKANGTIIPQLRAQGIPHRMLKEKEVPSWLPRHLPTTSIRINWDRAPDPAELAFCDTLDDRVATIDRLLRQQASSNDMLLFVYDGQDDPVMIRQVDALSCLPILCEPTWTIWITSPPRDWLIESHDYLVRLALPPELSFEDMALAQARRETLVAPMIEPFKMAGVAHDIFLATALGAPQLSRSIAPGGRVDWQRVQRTFQASVPRHNPAALASAIRPFLAQRCSTGARVAVRLLHSESPIVTLTADDLLRFIEPVMLAADRWDENAPGGQIDVIGMQVYPVDGAWAALLTVERAHWRVKAAG